MYRKYAPAGEVCVAAEVFIEQLSLAPTNEQESNVFSVSIATE
jgi:hypothetical protein